MVASDLLFQRVVTFVLNFSANYRAFRFRNQIFRKLLDILTLFLLQYGHFYLFWILQLVIVHNIKHIAKEANKLHHEERKTSPKFKNGRQKKKAQWINRQTPKTHNHLQISPQAPNTPKIHETAKPEHTSRSTATRSKSCVPNRLKSCSNLQTNSMSKIRTSSNVRT